MKEYPQSKLNRVKRGQVRARYDLNTIDQILKAGFLCYVAYIYEGKAITIPMAYGWKDHRFFLHGSQGNRMLNAILEAEEASITVMHLDGLVLARSGLHHSVNYRSATLFGKTTKIEDAKEKYFALECIMNQMIENHWNSLRPMYQKELDRTLVVEFHIETASAKVRDVGVNDEPEDYNTDVWAGIVPIKQVAEHPVSDPELKTAIEIPSHVMDYYHKNK